MLTLKENTFLQVLIKPFVILFFLRGSFHSWYIFISWSQELVEQKREEENRTTGIEAIINSMDVGQELAGDGSALKEPGKIFVL